MTEKITVMKVLTYSVANIRVMLATENATPVSEITWQDILKTAEAWATDELGSLDNTIWIDENGDSIQD